MTASDFKSVSPAFFTEYFYNQRTRNQFSSFQGFCAISPLGSQDVDTAGKHYDLHTHHFEHNVILVMGLIAGRYVPLAIYSTIQDESFIAVPKSAWKGENFKKAKERTSLGFQDRKTFQAIEDLLCQGQEVVS